MYNAGLKQKTIWIPRKSETVPVKMLKKVFMGRLEELTAGWSRVKLTRLFEIELKALEKYKKEVEGK